MHRLWNLTYYLIFPAYYSTTAVTRAFLLVTSASLLSNKEALEYYD